MPVKSERAKQVFWIILNVVLVVAVILGLSAVKALWKYGKSVYPSRVINVNAEGKVVVSPDVATLSFSVVSEGADPEKLQNDNTDKINKALDFVKSEGVESKDIKTAGYNLSPRYKYDQKTGRSSIDGYTLTQTVIVKIRDLSKVGRIMGGLPSRGINQIGSLSFDIDDPDKFLNEARKEAFEKALAKAEAMAEQNNVKVRRVINFSEFSGGYPGPIPLYAEALGKGGVGGPVSPTIEPGSQEVTVQVSVVYEIW
mgnify:FL=1